MIDRSSAEWQSVRIKLKEQNARIFVVPRRVASVALNAAKYDVPLRPLSNALLQCGGLLHLSHSHGHPFVKTHRAEESLAEEFAGRTALFFANDVNLNALWQLDAHPKLVSQGEKGATPLQCSPRTILIPVLFSPKTLTTQPRLSVRPWLTTASCRRATLSATPTFQTSTHCARSSSLYVFFFFFSFCLAAQGRANADSV
jgi:hypothetical protein